MSLKMFCFSRATSLAVSVSALAMTSTMFTFRCSLFISSRSIWRRLRRERGALERRQCVRSERLPVAPGRNEVQAAVDPVVLNVAPVQAALVGEVLPELVVDVVRAHLPALLAVHGVPEARRVDYGQPEPFFEKKNALQKNLTALFLWSEIKLRIPHSSARMIRTLYVPIRVFCRCL